MKEQEKNQKHQIEEINKKEAQNILKLYPHKFNSKIFNKFLTKSVSQEGVAYNREEYLRFLKPGIFGIGFAIFEGGRFFYAYKLEEFGIPRHDIYDLVFIGSVVILSSYFLSLAKGYYQEYGNELLKWDELDWIEYQSRLLNRDEKLKLMKSIKSEFEKNQKQNKRKEFIKIFKNKFTRLYS